MVRGMGSPVPSVICGIKSELKEARDVEIVPSLPQTVETWVTHEPSDSSLVKGCVCPRGYACVHTHVDTCVCRSLSINCEK